MTKNHNRPLGTTLAVLLLADILPAADDADPLAGGKLMQFCNFRLRAEVRYPPAVASPPREVFGTRCGAPSI